jgi:hypothetical protein
MFAPLAVRLAPMKKRVPILFACAVTAALAALAVVAQGHDRARHCGTLRVHYSDHGTRQYTQASHIEARGLHCGYARDVARQWAKRSHGITRLPRHVAGARCRYVRIGSDVGTTYCRTGQHHKLSFDAYDSSPFH